MTKEQTIFENWQPVIGLEIHVQLKTRSKIFSSAPNQFGEEPNVNIGVVDTGQPGSLPVLNKEAVVKAVMFGCAINAEVPLYCKFDRKSYFYPDSPRNFQITQFDQPIIVGGKILVELEEETKEFGIHHAHLEDDAGMLKHFTNFSGVDYNRAGVPLIEIVSLPCMHSPKEASAFARSIKAIMQYLDVSDCNMEEGSLRIDANVSVRPKGKQMLRPKTEIKNMNSFTNMELAIEAEIRRQIREYESRPGEDPSNVIVQATYRFDVEKRETILMRKKEAAADYRYFPEPDLPPLVFTREFIEMIRRNLPELPHERYQRYVEELQLSKAFASILINEKALSDYFEQALKSCKNARNLCNWLTVEFAGRLKDSGNSIWNVGIHPKHIATLVTLIDQGTVTGKIAKAIADEMVKFPGKDPNLIIEENPDFKPISNLSEIEPLVDQVLTENAQSITDFKAGKDKAFNFLVGQVMKLCKGKASPDLVKDLLIKKMQVID